MSKLFKTALFLGTLTLGYYAGKKFVNTTTKTDSYEIIQRENNHYLINEKQDTLQLQAINNQLVLGDLEYMIHTIKTALPETNYKSRERKQK